MTDHLAPMLRRNSSLCSTSLAALACVLLGLAGSSKSDDKTKTAAAPAAEAVRAESVAPTP
jgi:hypothetical protein